MPDQLTKEFTIIIQIMLQRVTQKETLLKKKKVKELLLKSCMAMEEN